MDILNMNPHSIQARLKAPDGSVDYATIQGRRRATIPEGFTVDTGWQSGATGVKVFESRHSNEPILLKAIPVVVEAAPIAPATAVTALASNSKKPDAAASAPETEMKAN